MEKKKISVEIAGSPITLVTDEPEDFVRLITDTINERIAELTKNSFRVSTLDAALLLAVDYLGDKLKAESAIRTLEAQLSVYEVNIQKLRDELKKKSDMPDDRNNESPNAQNNAENASEAIGNTIKESSEGSESRIRALEKYLDAKKSETGSPKSREEKIRYIESLLRGNDDGKNNENG